MRLAALMLFTGVLATAQGPLDRRFIGPPDQVEKGITYPLDLNKLGVAIPRIVGDGPADRRLSDPRTIFYKLTKVYQQWTPASRIKHEDLALGTTSFTSRPSIWNLFKTSVLPEFNANSDFPWEVTFGLNTAHRAGKLPTVYDVFNFLSLPEDEDGRLIPIIILADERPIKWIFPPGTMVGEIIYVKHEGKSYIQEIRTRIKAESQKTWHIGIYRPVKDRAEFVRLTGLNYEPSKKFFTFRNPEEDEVFLTAGFAEKIPDLQPAMTVSILQRPFQNVTLANWSPMSETEFSILPKDYSLGILGEPNSAICANCHRQTQISVRRLTPREPNIINNPLKVGNIRGCDGVFSWHPFDMRTVLTDDKQIMPATVYLRAFDNRNKTVQVLRRGQSTSLPYKMTLYVQDSLMPYELPNDSQFLHPEKKCDCDKTKCKCQGDCKCGGYMPKQWAAFYDTRRVIAVPDQAPVETKSSVETKREINVKAFPLVPGSKYQWYRGTIDARVWYYLREVSSSNWIGYYNTRTHQFYNLDDMQIQLPASVTIPEEAK